MKALIVLLFFTFILYSSNVAQEVNIKNGHISQGVKIYSICFFDSNNGLADSYFGEVLITTNGGRNWEVKTGDQVNELKAISQTETDIVWSADIYCDVMQSTDGGENWTPYPKKQEEHFCAVYFKDENTGWKVAEEFLQKVVSTITSNFSKDNWEQEIGVPQKCREYYTDMNTGWWVGWCYNNMVINNI